MSSAALHVDESFPHLEGGFLFDNARRSKVLKEQLGGTGAKLPGARKTGTTICGVVFDGGIVLGADTRATSNLVVDKNCEKIHYIAPNIYCCGAGTAADTEMTTAQISSELKLLRLSTGAQSRFVTAMTMLKRHLFGYQGHVSAALVLGGCDASGAHLYTVYPHGSTDKLPFVTMGSGSLAAMSVFESKYRDGMSENEARDLVCDAIRAGIFNDLGSGSNVDVCIIRKDGSVQNMRNYQTPNAQSSLRATVTVPHKALHFPAGTTKVVREDIRHFVTVADGDAMEL